jgi:class 3 adenylate cyclase
VRIIGSQGGDVLKFAGDALLVLWPPEEESNLETLTRRAAQAALEIQKKLHMAKLEEGVVLSVKLGIGVGKVAMVHVGGVLNRIEYLAVGDPLAQAFHAEHSAVAGQIVLSAKAWDLVKEWFVAESISDDGHVFLDAENGAKKDLRKVGIGAQFAHLGLSGDISVAKSVRNYVPGAVLPYLKENREERWASEIRRVAVVFINLGLSERELAEINSSDNNEELSRLQEVIYAVQTCVYRYEGSLNKFLMDDKGSTVVAVFGLPPLAHEDDSVRAVLSSLMIMKKLNELNLFPSIGVTTGAAFCGVVGGRVRREYTVLGDTVNLAARLMQYSMSHAKGIYCDSATSYLAQGYLPFDEVDTVKLKGKDKAVKILRPKIIPGWISPKVLVHSFMLSQRLDPIKKVSINGYSGKSSLAFGAMRFEDLEKFKIKKDDTLKQKPRASKFIFKNSPFLEVLQDASEGEYAAIKNFHINLPYNLGTLSISSKGIKNLYQIKDKAFEFMRKRTLLEIGMRREHFIFRLPDTSIHVRNEGINLDFLAELLSPYVVTLLFIELDLIKRSEATLRPDLQEFNPLFLHQIGADKAQEDFLSVIHSTLSRCKGITLLLEGEMGLGKTR